MSSGPRRHPVYLVLDNDLALLPIESQLFLRSQTITRVPSLPFIQKAC